jgi:hypothetical protein
VNINILVKEISCILQTIFYIVIIMYQTIIIIMYQTIFYHYYHEPVV